VVKLVIRKVVIPSEKLIQDIHFSTAQFTEFVVYTAKYHNSKMGQSGLKKSGFTLNNRQKEKFNFTLTGLC
jgi:hypothetical protein